MIRDILVHVPVGGKNDRGVEFAVSVAQSFGARLTGIAFALEFPVAATYFGAVPTEFMVESRRQAEQHASEAAARLRDRGRAAGIEIEMRTATLTADGAAAAFGRLARLYDVCVLTQPDPDNPGHEPVLLEAALFESGRPVLVVPYVHRQPLKLDRVLVAWDGGRAATRAVAEARPFLARAKKVELLVVETGSADASAIPGADLARHLARHGLNVELRRQLAESAGLIDETILNEVSDASVDFVVMGAYGHSRLREFVLGGVTRSIIESMTAPVLMAH